MKTPEPEQLPRFAPRPHVIVAGGGVAALEACLALGSSGAARVTLIAPDVAFTHRPPGSSAPFTRLPLAHVAEGAGAALLRDRVIDVEPDRRRVRTAGGRELRYDALLLATGAFGRRPAAPAPGRTPIFVASPGPIWRLELYELALRAVSDSSGSDAVLVTTEERPLHILGARASSLVAATLLAAGVRVRLGAYACSIAAEGVRTWPTGELVEGAVVETPRLIGRVPRGVPADVGGFVETDRLGRVAGVEGVYAAGDCTAFPVKHASLAAEQADAAVATITGAPAPFEPVLRWVLSGWLSWYIEAPIMGGRGDAARITTTPLWSAAACFGSRHLTPLLSRADTLPRRWRRDEIEPVRRPSRRPHVTRKG